MARAPHVADISDTATPLLDSFLHRDIRRVIVGAIAGVAAGAIMIMMTMVFAPVEGHQLWWFNLCASIFHGGGALAYDAPSKIVTCGAIFHFSIAVFLGLVVGKITQTLSLGRMLFYGFVLGFLCWLASNMFGPDLFDVQALGAVGEWARVGIFFPFTMSLTFFVWLGAKALGKSA